MFRQFLPVASKLGSSAFVVVATLAGCNSPQSPSPARSQTAIIDGERSPSGLEDAVLLLRATPPDGVERLCGATLVAPNLVVTARHCVAYATEGRFGCAATGELVEVDDGAGHLGVDLPPENLEFFTNDVPRTEPVAVGERVVSTLSDSACTNDLAFVVLDRSVELPILALRRNRPALEGESVVAVGYGADQDIDQFLDFETQRRRRKADLTIAAVGPDRAGVLGAAPPRIVIVDGPSACVGDSGGPLLASETHALLAVHSLIQGGCTGPDARGWFTHLPPLWTWVERAFEAAGATPTLEPEPPDPPCTGGGCGGEGGGGATGGSETGGSSAGGGASGAGGDDAGQSGAAPEPPAPRPARAQKANDGGGCSVSRGSTRSSSVWGALSVLAAALARRTRFRFSVGRRAGRSSASRASA